MKQLQLSKYEKIFTLDKVKFKCKYCTLIGTNIEVVKKHELQCHFNPVHRTCLTCQVYPTMLVCNYRTSGVSSCHRWKNVMFDRREKLNKIKEKLK